MMVLCVVFGCKGGRMLLLHYFCTCSQQVLEGLLRIRSKKVDECYYDETTTITCKIMKHVRSLVHLHYSMHAGYSE